MESVLNEVIDLAVRAGEMMLRETDVEIVDKGTKENYATSTDLKIQSFLREKLTQLIPDSAFLGEEDDLHNGRKTVLAGRKYTWIVDPIDGTSNYARGVPMSVVSIALAHSGEIVLGVVRHPRLGETFYAEKGKGAFLNGERLRVSDRPRDRCIVSLAWCCYNKNLAPMCFEISKRLYFDCEDLRRIGTAAYEICMIAKGAEEMEFEIRLAPWDYAAAVCVLREAGGYASSLDGDVSLDGSCTFIAANSEENLAYLRSVVVDVMGSFRVSD